MLAVSVTAAEPRAARDPIALAREGATAIEDRRFGEALEAFTEAAAMRPDNASLCFGAGVAAFMLGRNEVAQTRFECALALDPGYLPPAVWLGELHYRAGRLPDAISIYETARQRDPGTAELQQRLVAWRKEQELQGRFREARTAHFTALFEGPPTNHSLARLSSGSRRRTRESAPRSAHTRPSLLPLCSTHANSSLTSPGRAHGQRPRTTDASGCR